MSDDPGPIPAFLDRTRLIGTYTMLHCYDDICEYQAYHRYVAKTVKFVETPEIVWGNKVHKAFEKRVGSGQPLPTDMQQWEPFAKPFDGRGAKVETSLGLTEQGTPCAFFDNNVRFRVKVDVTLLNGTTAYIADWKTGNSKYEDPFELEIGAMHLHAVYPALTKIVGNYIWLKESRAGQLHDLSDTAGTWRKANHILGRMETARKTNEWTKKPSGLCGWCPVESCEHWRPRKAA